MKDKAPWEEEYESGPWNDFALGPWEDFSSKEDSASEIPGVDPALRVPFVPAPEPTALDYIRAGIEVPAALVASGVMSIPAMGGLALGGEAGFKKVMGEAYQPRTALGKEWFEGLLNSEPMRMLEAFPPTHSIRGALLGADAVSTAAKIRKLPVNKTEAIKEAIRTPQTSPPIQQEIPGLTATEGVGPQQALFDIPESGRVPMQYEAVPGDWRVDENGIPIKVGESLDVQHAQTPLQRDLWVDQTPEFATMQEGQISIPQALDKMTPEARAQAVRQSGLDQGAIEAPELAAAKIQADSYIQPSARSASPSLLPDDIGVSGPSRGPGLPKEVQPTSLAKYEAPVQAIERNIPGVGDRLREIGDSLIKSPEQAIELANKAMDVNQNILQKASNYLTKGGEFLKTRVKNPVFSYAVDEFVKADSLIRGKVSEKVQGQYLKPLRDLPNNEFIRTADILNTADLNKRIISPKEMESWGLSPKEQAFIQNHQRVMHEAFNELNSVREVLGKPPLEERPGYSMMSMHGDFRKLVTVLDENGNPVTVGAIGATTLKKLDKIEKLLASRRPEYKFSQMQTVGQRSSRGSPAAAFMDVLKTLGEDNPHIGEFVKELNELAKSDPSTFMGMDRHTLAKKGIFGMEGRKPWETPKQNAKDFFENQVRYLEGVYQWSELSKAAMNLNKVIHDPKVMVNHPNAVALAERYMTNALGLDPLVSGRAIDEVMTSWLHSTGIGSSIARDAAGASRLVANTMMLAFKPVFYIANMIQPNIAIPQTASILKAAGQEVGHLFGTDAIVKAANTALKDRLGKSLTPIESGALAYAKKHNIYSTDLVEHSRRPRKDLAYRGSVVAQWIPGKIESLTRGQVYLSIVHMLDKSGLKPKEGLYEQAQRFTDMAMNNYSYLEQPLAYKGLGMFGSLAYNLKNFGHNELSRWALMARMMGEDKTAKPLLTAMASTIAFAGVFGLPFYAQFEDLYNYITEKLGTPRRLTLDVIEANKALGQHLSDKGQFVVSNGLFSSLGVDLSKNIGLGDVVPNEPGALGFAGANIFADVTKGIGGVATNPTSPEYWKALGYAAAPTAVQGILDTQWYQRGDLAYSKDPSKSPEVTVQRTELDTLFRKLGMYGIHERTAKTKAYEEKMLNDSITTYRNKALEKIGNDLFENRPIAQKTIDQYFIAGQGDEDELIQGIETRAEKQNLSPEARKQIMLQATKSIPQLMRAEREMNAVTAKPAFGFGQ